MESEELLSPSLVLNIKIIVVNFALRSINVKERLKITVFHSSKKLLAQIIMDFNYIFL